MSSDEYLAAPVAAPPPNIPSSTSTVTVRVIDSKTSLLINPSIFWSPEIPGLGPIHAPIFSFLISNGSNEHVLFDLGVRRDWENYAPSTVHLVKSTTTVTTPPQNISAILDSDTSGLNIRSSSISAIIWSHHHFDHAGDPSTFPPTVPLVVGPGILPLLQPANAYPSNPSSPLLATDTSSGLRPVRELAFDDPTTTPSPPLRIGGFRAIDYFRNGALYLLDAPGHAPGHLCALARVTSAPDSFVLMTADACHHPALLRPSPYLPLPQHLNFPPNMTGTALRAIHPQHSATAPFFTPGERAFPAKAEALETLRKIMELDALDNVLVVMAHDGSLAGGGAMELFPASINQWMAEGVKERTRWLFCKDFEGAMEKLS